MVYIDAGSKGILIFVSNQLFMRQKIMAQHLMGPVVAKASSGGDWKR